MLWIIIVPQTAFKYLVNSILVALATLSSTSSKLMWKRKRHHQQWSNFLHQWWWWWWQRKRRIWCHPRFELLPTKPRTNHQEIKCPKAMLLTLFTIHSNLCQCYQLEKKMKMGALKLQNFYVMWFFIKIDSYEVLNLNLVHFDTLIAVPKFSKIANYLTWNERIKYL